VPIAPADVLYGGERKLVTVSMSKYQEARSVSGLRVRSPGTWASANLESA
jgi:ATP-dependent Clp protease ATP-binding subunit ClpA